MTDELGKSDSPTVPGKSPNNALPQQNASRTPSRKDAPSELERIRQAAKKDKKLWFTALLHHIYNLETLRMAYFSLKKEAAPGVDGETWRHYGEELERNLQDLSERLQRGGYRAKPVGRVYIPKADGRQRPLGVTALEDKIVQRAAVEEHRVADRRVVRLIQKWLNAGVLEDEQPGAGSFSLPSGTALASLAVAA
jgi:RNA-directed DNA polymerase